MIRKKTKNRTHCCVEGCNNSAYKDPSIQYFRFPLKNVMFVKSVNIFNKEEKIDRHDAWIRALNLHKEVTPVMKVCSVHFTTQDLIPSNSRIRHLKKNAVPSLNLPLFSDQCITSTMVKVIEREKKVKKRLTLKKNDTTCNNFSKDSSKISSQEENENENENEQIINREIKRSETEDNPKMSNTKSKDDIILEDHIHTSAHVNDNFITWNFIDEWSD